MQKFRFSLNTVLAYKQQIEDSLQSEYSAALARVREQEETLEALRQAYRDCGAEYTAVCGAGLAILEALAYQGRLRAFEREIEEGEKQLTQLQEQAEEKRQAVVEARKETASLEKLKEKKLGEYNKAFSKSEELAVEEFISAVRARQRA